MEKISLYYFNLGKPTLGRGENLKLFFVDAGLEHDYIRFNRETEWPEMREEIIKDGYYAGSAPYIKMGNKIIGRTVPTMRYISTKLGNKYHGSTDEESYLLDVVSDVTNDWFESIKKLYLGSEEEKKRHVEITYPDFLVYHLLDDDQCLQRLDEYPNLKAFAKAFEERPNIKEYLISLK
ncbi:uncharacterized protein RHIMIDRAFT_284951 [Rhizopus microsporus ATCC 52813]|uniref:Glutathione S-transferase C-terminal domain-containing protein n=1 Tax=Rhizopus microsporus ATCC 52813 TaxID=1340429 RepID=A0A2G4T8U1_RHIZD|nr:uncharacterized protein RHIMIDRAFT_284951 [Rhizopus microsporus ATCC 52813]PHZ17439.1 hypothetical protein RHIMIDRAFT_284951 [Rhizopus microsporus ATCC 52813]